MNIYHHTLQSTKEKYLKFKHRLEKNIESGAFDSLPRRKKNKLLSRVEKFRSRLESSTIIRRGAVVAGAAALIPGFASAQVEALPGGDPLIRFDRGEHSLSPSGADRQVEMVNIDADADLEILISTANGGYAYDKNKNGYFEHLPINLDDMSEEFYVGDVDGDSDIDIVYAERIDGTYFYLALNDGDGNFQLTQQSYMSNDGSIGYISNPTDVHLVDFDTDGDLDLVVAYNGDQLQIFSNDGSGYFSDAQNLYVSGTSGLTEFEFADLDNDHDLDLIHNQQNGDRVFARENVAGVGAVPSFGGTNTELAFVSSSAFENITVFDMDDDGDLDIFMPNNSFNYSHQLLENEYNEGSAFSFSSVTVTGLPATEDIFDVEVADLDGDGIDDLLIASESDTHAAIYDGTELSASNRSLKSEIGDASVDFVSLSMGDIDGDGLLDVIGAYDSSVSDNIYIYYDRSAPEISDFDGDVIVDENSPAGALGSFTFSDFHDDDITVIGLTGEHASAFAWDDDTNTLSNIEALDWESIGSKVDLSFTLSDGNKTRTEDIGIRLKNLAEKGNGLLKEQSARIDFDRDKYLDFFTSVDFDMDGDDDLFIDEDFLLVSKEVTFEIRPIYNFSSQATEVAFIDVDDDGDLDLFGLDEGGSIYLLENVDQTVSSDGWNTFDSYPVNSQTFGLTTGDFDDDGLDEVAYITSSAGSYYFRTLEFSPDNRDLLAIVKDITLETSAGSGPMVDAGRFTDIAIADFDGDGNDDLLVITEQDGDGPGTDVLFSGFDSSATSIIGSNPDNGFNAVEIGDLNGDGDIDLVMMRSNGTEVAVDIMSNDGSGAFSVTQSMILGGDEATAQFDLKLGDMDGDGSLDVIASATDEYGDYSLKMWSNDGNGSFTLAQTIQDFSGYKFELMDLDGDDGLDVIVREASGYNNYGYLNVHYNENVPASEIALTTTAIDEHLPEDTQVSGIVVTDANLKDTHVVTLADGDGTNDAHNNFFAVNDGNLIITRDVSSENFPSLNILLEANDGENVYQQAFTLTVNQVNLAPTAIAVAPDNFDEGTSVGTSVGTLSATDDGVEPISFELATGDGTNDADNGSFRIEGDQLIIEETTRFETKATYNIYVRAYDIDGSTEQAFVLDVNDVNQAPTAIGLSSTSINEDITPGTSIGNILVTDPNSGDSHAFALVDGAGDDDNDSFIVQGNKLILISQLEFNNTPTLSVRISANDGSESFAQAIPLTVNEVLGLDDELRNVLGIYPNPGKNEIQFNIENDLYGEMLINVTDLSGRSMHQLSAKKSARNWTFDLDMSNQESGVYIVEATIGPVKLTQRWVKQD